VIEGINAKKVNRSRRSSQLQASITFAAGTKEAASQAIGLLQ
jgi:hypothetical protein